MVNTDDIPVGIVTKQDLENLNFGLIKPNEYLAVYEEYVAKEKNARNSKFDKLKNEIPTTEKFFGFNIQRDYYEWKMDYEFLEASYDWECKDILKDAKEKQYQVFVWLKPSEIDDMVIHHKSYETSLTLRKIVDFFDPKKHTLSTDIVCYISHQQQRDLTWFKKNQAMLKQLLDDYNRTHTYYAGN